MTISEMHVAVDLGLQRIASEVYDGFLPQEIDSYLNRASTKFIQARRDAIISTPEIPAGVQAAEDLRTMLEIAALDTSAFPGDPAVFTSDLPDDFEYYLDSRTFVGTGWKLNKRVTPTRFYEYTTTVDDRPLFDTLPVTIVGSKLHVIPDSDDEGAESTSLTYLHKQIPVKLDVENGGTNNVDSELPSHTHQMIVDIAVELMLSDLKVVQSER